MSQTSNKSVKSATLGPLERAKRHWLFVRMGMKVAREKSLGGNKGVKREYKANHVIRSDWETTLRILVLWILDVCD